MEYWFWEEHPEDIINEQKTEDHYKNLQIVCSKNRKTTNHNTQSNDIVVNDLTSENP